MLLKFILSLLVAVFTLLNAKTQAFQPSFTFDSYSIEPFRQLMRGMTSWPMAPAESLWTIRGLSNALTTLEEATLMMDRLDPLVDKYQSWIKDSLCLNGGQNVDGMCLDLANFADRYEVSIELPGFRKEDVQLTVQGDSLQLTAEKPVRPRLHRMNCATCFEHLTVDGDPSSASNASDSSTSAVEETHKVSKAFELPRDADKDGVVAVLQDGVLLVTVAKKGAADTPQEGKKIVIL